MKDMMNNNAEKVDQMNETMKNNSLVVNDTIKNSIEVALARDDILRIVKEARAVVIIGKVSEEGVAYFGPPERNQKF